MAGLVYFGAGCGRSSFWLAARPLVFLQTETGKTVYTTCATYTVQVSDVSANRHGLKV
jgi:hypothetical protein